MVDVGQKFVPRNVDLDGNSGVPISSCGFDGGVDLGRNSGVSISCGLSRGTGFLYMRLSKAAWWTTICVGFGVGAVERSPGRIRVLQEFEVRERQSPNGCQSNS